MTKANITHCSFLYSFTQNGSFSGNPVNQKKDRKREDFLGRFDVTIFGLFLEKKLGKKLWKKLGLLTILVGKKN